MWSKHMVPLKTWFVGFVFILGLLWFSVPQAQADSIYYHGYPKGKIGISKPTIGFQITETDLQALSRLTLRIDGEQVQGVFDREQRSIVYTPDSSLAAGEHRVEVAILFAGYKEAKQEWTFTISDKAVQDLPSSYTKDQQQGLKTINDYRQLYGLQPLKFNANLSLAAQKHADYLFANRAASGDLSMHDEIASMPGFIGESPLKRAAYAGYVLNYGVGEDISYLTGDLVKSIDVLFDAPYHRKPFLLSHAVDLGIGIKGDYTVLNFGFDEEKSLSLLVSPVPGDKYVPIDFDGNEIPNPIRMYKDAHYPVGYPIMAAVSSLEKDQQVKLEEASLKDITGQPIPFFTNTPQNDDHLQEEVFLIPKKSLLPDTTYSAYVKLSVTQGQTVTMLEKQWDFHTEPAPSIGKQKLHFDVGSYVQLLASKDKVKHYVTFGLDEDKFVLDGFILPMQHRPIVIDGSSYLWIRDLANALGATVTWDDERKAAIYQKNGRVVTFYTSRPGYEIDGMEKSAENSAKLINESTYIPVRLLSETIGADVEYVPDTRRVRLSYDSK